MSNRNRQLSSEMSSLLPALNEGLSDELLEVIPVEEENKVSESKLNNLYEINNVISGYRLSEIYSSISDNTKELVEKYIEEHNLSNNPKKELYGLFKICTCNSTDINHVNQSHNPHHYDCEHGRIYL